MLTATATNVWFGGRLLMPEDHAPSIGKYFPFGEGRTNPNPANSPNDQEKFATYTRDSATGLDYAYQRYYNSQSGRFHTPDPYRASAQGTKPQSWNRYAYSESDPVNGNDPSGLFASATGGLGGGYSPEDPFDCDSLNMFFDDQDSYLMMPMNSTCNAGLTIALAYYGGGGGAGGGSSFATAQLSLQSALNTLKTYKFSSPQCQKDLNALDVSAAQIQKAAGATTFQDGLTSSANYASAAWGNTQAYNANLKIYQNLTMSGFFQSNPGTVAVAQALGHTIYIDPTYVNDSSSTTLDAMEVHEIVHNLTGNVDTTLQDQLNTVLPNGQKLTVGAASVNITNQIAKDCF
jgi:RHS repeat-associated protein